MRKITLTKEEKLIEKSLDQFIPISKEEHAEIVHAITTRKKDAVLNTRVNGNDIKP
jgi:hypothetical protein